MSVKLALAFGLGSIAAAGAAQAQDAQGQAWNGFYLGATAGASQGELNLKRAPLYTANPSSFFGTFGGTVANSSPKFDADGGEYGVTAGHNWQSGRWVYGIEMDASRSTADGSLTIADRPSAGTNRFTTQLDGEIQNWGTLRARVGYSFGPVLLYGTAGGAAQTVKFNRNYVNSAGARINGGAEQDYTGTAYGAGAEWAFANNWSIKGEYIRLDYNDQDIDTLYSDGTSATANIDADRDVVRAGVNYRF